MIDSVNPGAYHFSMTRSNTRYAGDLRRDLLDAALEVVRDADPAQLSLRAVARSVGVSHAAPKNHFRDKTALLTALAIEGFERLADVMDAAAAEASEPREALELVGRAYLRFSMTCPGYFRVMWRNELLDLSDSVLESIGLRTFERLMSLTTEAQASGWAPGHPPSDLAMTLWSAVHGAAQLHLDGPLSEMDGRPADAIFEGVLRVLLSGV